MGLGVREALAAPAVGRVVAVYRVAAYLRFPAGLVALTSGLAPPGPLHLRVAVLAELRPGDRVEAAAGVLYGPGWSADLGGAPTWTGTLPAGPHPGPGAGARGGSGVPAPAAVHELAARVGGRGPGLTPVGDDVLAGALLAVRAAHGPAVGPELRAVATSVRTTEVAAAFLAWAARGQCIEPAHAWLTAADDDARRRAERRLTAIGASSGAALSAGLRWGTGQVSGTDIQIARVGPELDQLCGRSVR
ncbi:DUF2877 domain-containing protein [Pseudonocardia sp.]|uniref:oxamate carbamoyltransferase subunit AllH family protein n=1 Tax=Pseudonocardia sp. TaxID=60912 RepID=UPI002631F37D|nr:DUF2877 domain-containing protein [Pseudonocardia sp.]